MTRPMPGPPDARHVFYSFPHTHPDDALGACPKCFVDSRGERESVAKRLTDAECWSEHHHADAAWAKAMVQVLMGYRPMTDELNAGLKLQIAEAETWHRFATHPHAFKETRA